MRTVRFRLQWFLILAAVTAACLPPVLYQSGTAIAAPRRPQAKKKAKPKPKLPDLKTPEDKLKFLAAIRSQFPAVRVGRTSTFTSEDLDDSLERYIARGTSTPFARVVDDETFLRRVSIDLTGTVPTRKEIRAFVDDPDPKKRSKKIDELLETDAWARKWARYWRSAVFYNSNAPNSMVNRQAFEDWLFEEFKAGSPWDRIVAEMISASPKRVRKRKAQDNGWEQDYGPNNFILACERKPEVIASNSARLFMGISIGCAECHDHPFDQWSREQFHELAAFFAPGKYYMTDQYDPTEKSLVQAKFLLGEQPPASLKPDQRRVAVAAYLIYNPDNYWFARAYVNRMWNELIGDGFYSVDSLGPDKEVMHKLVVNRLAATFRYAAFDVKWLFRTITNSRTYQREIRTIDEDRDLFTGVRPARLRPYEVAASTRQLLGEDRNIERTINRIFDADPSVPQRDLEGSMQQALLFMNNGAIQRRLAGSGLKKQLAKIKSNDQLVREAFLGVLARSPNERELKRYTSYLASAKNRNEAIDDILWVLFNSAEFITKR